MVEGDPIQIKFTVNQNTDFSQIFHNSNQDIDERSMTLIPGNEYEIRVSISGQKSTEAFDDLTLEQRKCRLAQEVEKSSLSKIYTKKKCKYECHIKKAFEKIQEKSEDFVSPKIVLLTASDFSHSEDLSSAVELIKDNLINKLFVQICK